jgi:hypothetical protein
MHFLSLLASLGVAVSTRSRHNVRCRLPQTIPHLTEQFNMETVRVRLRALLSCPVDVLAASRSSPQPIAGSFRLAAGRE